MLLYDALPKVIYYGLKKEGRADDSAGRMKIGNTGADQLHYVERFGLKCSFG